MLLAILALDVAAFAHGDLAANPAAIVALIIAIIAVAFDLRGRGAF